MNQNDSSSKVPDPIAMVAADIYDPQNATDDCDAEEYKVKYKRSRPSTGAETADEDEYSKGDENGENLHQSGRKRRKKRRPGDDPELEALERRTKVKGWI